MPVAPVAVMPRATRRRGGREGAGLAGGAWGAAAAFVAALVVVCGELAGAGELVTGRGAVVVDGAELGAAVLLVAAGCWRRRVTRRSSLRCAGRVAGDEATRGASPVATESGSDERPTRWPPSWLAAQASAALTAMPSTAATAVAIDRRVMARGRYAPAG